MQSIGTAACLRRSLAATSRSLKTAPESIVVSRQCLRLGHQPLLRKATSPRHIATGRAFSISAARRFADVNDSFDPKSVDRESDEVDVCIVGGGMSLRTLSLLRLISSRSCRTQRCDTIKAIGERSWQ